jgi:hypothetical protein
MHTAPKIFITLLFATLFAGSCASTGTENSNANGQTANAVNTNTANSVKDDIEELELTIKMPFHPEEAVWREDLMGKMGDNRVPAPTDKKLTAVLRFLKDDAAKVVAQAEKYKPAAPATIPTEKWFPAELIAQSQTSGDETVKGLSYPANDFLNPPYADGKITRIEGTDYFVLELFTK